MRSLGLLLCIMLVPVGAAIADPGQEDWSGGSGVPGPVAMWGAAFDSASGISWRALPGQLALSGSALGFPLETRIEASLSGGFGIRGGDIDGDGDVDVVRANETYGDVQAWYNDGASPPGWTGQQIDGAYAGATGLELADLDDDGDLDLVGCSGSASGSLVCWYNDGSVPVNWQRQTIAASWPDAYEITTGDVDGDGRLDIIGTAWTPADVAWWHNGGGNPVTWTKHVVDSSFSGAHSVQPGDLDGDGDTDLVACGATANQVVWYRNDGLDPPGFTKTVLTTAISGARSVAVADFDNDLDLDIVAVGWVGRVSVLLNQGGDPPTFSYHSLYSSFSGGHHVEAADLNGDGHMDVLACAYTSNLIMWWENVPGSPPTWTRRSIDGFMARAIAVDHCDVDGDGALEVLGSSNTNGGYSWYEITAFTAAGGLTSSLLDAGSTPLTHVDWSATTPPGTSFGIQTRSGNDPGLLGPWSTTVTTPGPLPIPGDRYIQYRVMLETTTNASPILDSVDFTSDLSSVTPNADGRVVRPPACYPNPCNPGTTVAFEIARPTRVELAVYGLRGHLVDRLYFGDLPPGHHEFPWDGRDAAGRDAATGTYCIRLRTSEGEATARLSLVR